MLKSIILMFCLCTGFVLSMPALDEESAKKFIIESSDKFAERFDTLGESIFTLTDLINDEDDSDEDTKTSKSNEISFSDTDELTFDDLTGLYAFFAALAQLGKLVEATESITTLAEEAYRFPVDQFKDEEVKNGILKLKTMPGLLAAKDFEKWNEDNFDEFLEKQNYCTCELKDKKCHEKYSKIAQLIKSSNNSEEILHYWKELRQRNSPEVVKKLKQLIEMLEDLSEKYKTSVKFVWFRDYLDENFGDEMEKVIIELEPLYKELHAYIRHVLHEQYGETVPADGLIPHHLYEQVMSQAWQPNSYAAKEFKGVKMPIENNFNETAKQVIDIASNFMKSLGLSDLPEDFWQNRTKETNSNSDDCQSEVFDSGNLSWLIYCKDVSIRSFLQMHGYITRIYYANEQKAIPFAYKDPYNFELSTGEAVILSSSTPKYLHQIGHKESPILTPEEDMNRLFRMGVHTLLSVPEYFVHVKVVADVLDNTIPVTEMNKHYWDLMKKYLGVASPIETTPEAIDFPRKVYKHFDQNGQSAKFVSEIIGYQIYKSLCEKSGEYIKGDKTRLLHNCNFYNSKDAGETLKQMMQLGSKKSWKKLLSVITGDETGMKADGMLEYFEPLKNWLHTKNTEHGVKVGW